MINASLASICSAVDKAKSLVASIDVTALDADTISKLNGLKNVLSDLKTEVD